MMMGSADMDTVLSYVIWLFCLSLPVNLIFLMGWWLSNDNDD